MRCALLSPLASSHFVVEAEDTVLIVNEQLEVPQKIDAENSTNQIKIGFPGRFEIRDDHERVRYSLRANVE